MLRMAGGVTAQLLLKPGGFEGFVALLKDPSFGALVVHKPCDGPQTKIRLRPARLTPCRHGKIDEYSAVAGLDDLVGLGTDALPRFLELAEPLSDFRSPLVDPGTLGPEHGVLPFNIWAEDGNERVRVSSVEGANLLQDDLDVLLRHRAGSISPCLR